jgi:16S rRNA (cytosine967-C5)-methyltransferase
MSYPPWLTARWLAAFGAERAHAIARAQNTRPGLHGWADPARGGTEAAVRALADEGVVATPTAHGFRVDEGAPRVTASRPFREGWMLIQDETAASVVPFLDVQRGDRVLEVGAAPGTKTVQLAGAVGEAGCVLAVDRSRRRLERVRENLVRFGLESRVELVAASGEHLAVPAAGGFDRLLVDAPCSNTGVLARRPDARWRLEPDDVTNLAAIQRGLLRAGLEALRPGGRAVYATCSIEAAENEGVATAVGDLATVDTDVLTLPDGLRDGGYKARLVKE